LTDGSARSAAVASGYVAALAPGVKVLTGRLVQVFHVR